jgi:hypothetical protein
MSIQTVKAQSTAWVPGDGVFVWPPDVAVTFPNGDTYDAEGARNHAGVSIDYNTDGTGACGSPCHQALLLEGLLPANG